MAVFPKISIVTPSFNQGRFIEATITSVISQEGDFLLEYIIMDAGSTDDSVETIRKYDGLLREKKYPVRCKGIEFSWVSEKDDGQADAINKGFARCTGEVLNWINSDDRLKPGALSSLVQSMRTQPDAGAWAGSCELVDERGKVLKLVRPFGLTKDQLASWGITGFFFQPSLFMSRTAWEKSGPLDTNLYIAFDLDLFLKIAGGFQIFGTDVLWSEATIHGDAKTTAKKPLMKAEKYVVQARHGYERLAISNIERGEKIATWVEDNFLYRQCVFAAAVFRGIKTKLTGAGR